MEQVRQAYGAVAESYIDLFGSSAAVHVDDLALITRHLSIRPGVVVDAGCGPGHLTEHVCSPAVETIGIDLVPEFVAHARGAHRRARFGLGSMHDLPVADRSVVGLLAWYSLIHVPPDEIDDVLAELRRVMTPGGTLVAGFFEGEDVAAFAHKVTTAFSWPVDALSARLAQAGLVEIERHRRPGRVGVRPHAVIVARSRYVQPK